MFRLILNNLLKRRERASLVAVSGVVIAASFAVFVSASSATTVSADQALSKYWRTTYDILVRHPDAVTDIERNYGIVEANHLSGIPGGISFDQYETIKSIDGVEVAAPIAMLGYVPRNQIQVGIRDFFPTGIYRITASSQVNTGHRVQELSLPGPYFALFTQGFDPAQFPSEDTRNELTEEMFDLGLGGAGDADFYGFRIPVPHFDDRALLAAIDPEQEAALVNLDQMILEGRYLSSATETFLDDQGYPRIPVLLNVHDYIDQTMTIRIEQVEVGDFPVPAVEGERYRGYRDESLLGRLRGIDGRQDIENAPREVVWERTIPIGREWRKTGMAIQILGEEFLRPYDFGSGLTGQILSPDSIEYRILPAGSERFPEFGLTLEALPISASSRIETIDDVVEEFGREEFSEFHALTQWRRDSEVIFRDLAPRFQEQIRLDPIVQGVFEIDPIIALGDRSPNQVPLETYLPPLVTLKYDAQRNPVQDEPTIRPTLNYEGYLVSPPDMLMSFDGARALLEHSCFVWVDAPPPLYWDFQKSDCSTSTDDIISAIRIRVGGIDELTPEAQLRIEEIAQEIVEETGLHVDIMVGSSPQPVLVHIPGFGEAPELGYVEELWVQKGVSTLVTEGINRADTLLFGSMLAVSLLFLFNANYVSVLGRMQEFGVMLALGWRRATLFGMILGEGILLGLLSSALGVLASWGLVRALNLAIPIERILWLVPLGAVLFLLGSLLPAVVASRAQPSAVMRAGETRDLRRAPRGDSLWSYAAGGVLRRPTRTLVTVSGLALSSAFLVLLNLVLDGLDGALYGTLLGQWVRTQVQPYHFMMGAVALLAAALGAAVLMLLNIMQRRHEIGLLVALGWRRVDLLGLFLRESGLVALFSGLVGTGLGLALFYFGYRGTPEGLMGWLAVGGLGILLPVVVVEAATLYPADRGARLLPLEALRGEERLAGGLGQARAVAWVGVMAALVLALALGAFWAGGGLPEPEPTPQAVAAEVQATPTFEPAPAPAATPTSVGVDALSRYDVRLDIDPVERQAGGQASIHFVNDTGDTLQEVVLRVYANYPQRSAGGEVLIEERLEVAALRVDGEQVDYEHLPEQAALRIPLPQPLEAGEAIDLGLDFSYQIPNPIGSTEEVLELYSFTPILAYHDETGWRTDVCDECLDDFTSPMANIRLTFTAPDGWEVVASGERVVETALEGGRVEYVYEARPARDLAIALGRDLPIETQEIDGVTLNVYGVDREDLAALSGIAGQVFRAHRANLGAYPYETLNVLLLPGSFNSGLDYPQLSFVVYETIDTELEQVLSRYMAYQWWAQTVGVDIYHEAWLTEGLADYSALLYMEGALGGGIKEQVLRQYHTEISVLELETGREFGLGESVWDLNEQGPFVYLEVTQKKGALFLDELRETIGEGAFLSGLKTYFLQYRFGVGDGEGFLEVMQRASNRNLRPLFEEWGIFSGP